MIGSKKDLVFVIVITLVSLVLMGSTYFIDSVPIANKLAVIGRFIMFISCGGWQSLFYWEVSQSNDKFRTINIVLVLLIFVTVFILFNFPFQDHVNIEWVNQTTLNK